MIKLYTQSSLNAGLQCPTLYRYKYVDLYRTKPTTAMVNGLTLHDGLEGFFNMKSLEEAIAGMREYVSKELPGWIEDNPEGWIKLKVYLTGYYKNWEKLRTADLKNKIVFTEHEFQFECNGVMLGGKWDALVYDPETMTAVVTEHKSTGTKLLSEADSYFAKLPLDTQCTIYREAAYQFLTMQGYKLVAMPSVVYDVIRTSKSMPKSKKRIVRRKNETDGELNQRKQDAVENLLEFEMRMTEEYLMGTEVKYYRYEVPYVASNHKRRLIELTEYAKLLSNKGFLEIRNSTSCGNYGGCPYMDVCIGRERLDDSLKFTKLEGAHPELPVLSGK